MKVGTKSVLFGAHAFYLHPFFVAWAWTKLYGFPLDPRLWFAFFLHDLGYIGKPNMDGPEGERHVEWGARAMSFLFDSWTEEQRKAEIVIEPPDGMSWRCGPWGQFSLFHSRFYARKHSRRYSRLCVADKLSVALEPAWLYLLRVRLSGELTEYMALAAGKNGSKYAGEPNTEAVARDVASDDPKVWFRGMSEYCRQWAMEHRDGRQDTWTPMPKT